MSDLFKEKYYEAARAPRRLPESHSESRLRQVLSDDNLQIVRDAVERWNAPLRDAVRSATALKFADGLGRVAEIHRTETRSDRILSARSRPFPVLK